MHALQVLLYLQSNYHDFDVSTQIHYIMQLTNNYYTAPPDEEEEGYGGASASAGPSASASAGPSASASAGFSEGPMPAASASASASAGASGSQQHPTHELPANLNDYKRFIGQTWYPKSGSTGHYMQIEQELLNNCIDPHTGKLYTKAGINALRPHGGKYTEFLYQLLLESKLKYGQPKGKPYTL
jgi:hypothetical protein